MSAAFSCSSAESETARRKPSSPSSSVLQVTSPALSLSVGHLLKFIKRSWWVWGSRSAGFPEPGYVYTSWAF